MPAPGLKFAVWLNIGQLRTVTDPDTVFASIFLGKHVEVGF